MADSVISVECMACHEATAPMEEWSYDIASSCPDGCVDVEITHCGVCGSDVHQLENGCAPIHAIAGFWLVVLCLCHWRSAESLTA